MFSKPKSPKLPPPPPPVPTVDEAQERADMEMRGRRRRGRAPYILAGKSSGAAPTVATKTMVGQ